MLAKSKKKINSYNIGDVVLLKVDGVDRGAADPENIMCVIKKKCYGQVVKREKLNTIFPFNVCDKTTYPGFTSEGVPDVELGVMTFQGLCRFFKFTI